MAEFKYLGMLVESEGGTEEEIKNRVMEVMKGGLYFFEYILREVWKKERKYRKK